MGFPGGGMVLADPGLAEAEFVRPAELLQVPLVPVEKAALRRVRRHREQSVIHMILPDDPPWGLNVRRSTLQTWTSRYWAVCA